MSRLNDKPQTVLEAIRMKLWDFEPTPSGQDDFEACASMPGTTAKLSILADRVRRGLPLWHPGDRRDLEEAVE